MTEWIDDVLSIVLQQGRSSKANSISDSQSLLCHTQHLKFLMPSDALDKVSTFPSRAVHAARRQRGQARCQLAELALSLVPCFRDILIETVIRHTKDAIAELCKSSSMLTQDSINEAIREVNVRTGGVDGIEYIRQKRMVEADHLSFTVEREMQSWQQEVRFSLCSAQVGVRRPQRRFAEVVW